MRRNSCERAGDPPYIAWMRCTTRSQATAALTSAVLVLTLGACGDSDDDAGGATTSAQVEVADPPVATDPGGVTDQTQSTTPADGTDTSSPGTTATEQPPTADAACGLTDEQVSSVMGVDMVAIEGTCGWEAPGLSGAVVEVYVSGGDAAMWSGADGEEVAGVGDEARFDFLDVLNFRIGDNFYYVQVLNMGGASAISSHDASVALAKLWVATFT
jgi:hypothetical protein